MGSVGSLLAFVRYLVSGLSSVFVQFAVLAFFVETLRLEETLSSGTAFLIACVVNYLMLYYWAFRASGSHVTATVRYAGVTGFGLLLNLLLFWFLMNKLHLWYLLAQSLATFAVSILTYLINRAYTFSNQKQVADGD